MLAWRIRRSGDRVLWYIPIIKQTRCTNFSNLFWIKTLHVSDSSSVHHQEFFTVHTAMVYVIQLASRIRMECPDSASKLSEKSVTYTIAVCTVKNSNGICHTSFADSLQAESGCSVPILQCVQWKTAMVYVIQVLLTACEQNQDVLSWSCSVYSEKQQWYMSYKFCDSLQAESGCSVLILQCVQWKTAMVYVTQVLLTACKQDQDVLSWSCLQAVWHIPLLCVQWKAPDDGQRNCPKHAEF